MRSVRHALCVLPLLAAPAAAQLVGFYTVNPTLPSSATNFTSLQAVVTALGTSGVAGPVFIDVYDDAGPYNELFPFTTSNVTYNPSNAALMFGPWVGVSTVNRVVFRPGPGECPVLDATGRGMGVYWNGADYVTLEGFEIKNATYDAITLYSEAAVGQVVDAVITGCRIHDCGGTGVTVYGNVPNPLNTLIENCFFWHLQTTNAGGFNTTARFGYVSTRRAQGTRVVNCSFFLDTGAGGLFCALGTNASGVGEVTFAEISNNAFLKLAAPARPFFHFSTPTNSTSPTPLISDGNCFFDLSAGPFANYGPSGATQALTLLDWQTNALLDLASRNADPQFLDPVSGNLHIPATSPCVAGSTLAGATVDIDGQARIGRMDIGADQFSAATVASSGAGCPGTNALVPALSTCHWPFLGNANFALQTAQAPPGAPVLAFLSFGLSPVPFPVGAGCDVFLSLGSLAGLGTSAIAGPAGTAGIRLPLPNLPGLVGVSIGAQELVLDSGAPLGLTLTNALLLGLAF